MCSLQSQFESLKYDEMIIKSGGELHHFYLIRKVNCSHSRGLGLTGIDKKTRLRIGPAFIIDGKPGEATGKREKVNQNKTHM